MFLTLDVRGREKWAVVVMFLGNRTALCSGVVGAGVVHMGLGAGKGYKYDGEGWRGTGCLIIQPL